MPTIAIQDIVEGQQRAVFTPLSQEQTTAESTTREQKGQATTLKSDPSLSAFPHVYARCRAEIFPSQSSIRTNYSNPDNAELQARLKDMSEAVVNLGHIAESFACSTGLCLVPVRSKRKTIPDIPTLTERFSLQS